LTLDPDKPVREKKSHAIISKTPSLTRNQTRSQGKVHQQPP
jgi:hypothetical protein